MSRGTFDTLTDWIGIPLVVLLLAVLVLLDIRSINVKPIARRSVYTAIIFGVATFVLAIVRFAWLA